MIVKEIKIKAGKSFRQYSDVTLVSGDAYAYKIVYTTDYNLDNAAFQVSAIRMDGSAVIGKGDVMGGAASYVLANNMYEYDGEVKLRLTLMDGTSVLTETEVVFNVVGNNTEDQIEEDDRFPILAQLIQETEQFLQETDIKLEAEAEARTNGDINLQNQINNKADKQTKSGGFAGGGGTNLASGTGSAVGYNAKAADGFAGGSGAGANSGAASGSGAYTENGSSTGKGAKSIEGGASGRDAVTSDGFAGGKGAKCIDTSKYPASDYRSWIDAIQLGEGTNDVPRSLKVYGKQLLDAEGHITKERLVNTSYGFEAGLNAEAGRGGAIGIDAQSGVGFAGGEGAYTTDGGAVGFCARAGYGCAAGYEAKVGSGGAVGQGAMAGDGFAGGKAALTVDENELFIDAVQLGTGTNGTPNTLQVYDYQLLDAGGHIPKERLSNSDGGFSAGESAGTFGGVAIGQGAVAMDPNGASIDAIQLGRGTNITPETLQVYGYRLLNPDGTIPVERLTDVSPTTIGNQAFLDYKNKCIVTNIENYLIFDNDGTILVRTPAFEAYAEHEKISVPQLDLRINSSSVTGDRSENLYLIYNRNTKSEYRILYRGAIPEIDDGFLKPTDLSGNEQLLGAFGKLYCDDNDAVHLMFWDTIYVDGTLDLFHIDFSENFPPTLSLTDNDILSKGNMTEYTPVADYHPATKKYVDDAIANAIAQIVNSGK